MIKRKAQKNNVMYKIIDTPFMYIILNRLYKKSVSCKSPVIHYWDYQSTKKIIIEHHVFKLFVPLSNLQKPDFGVMVLTLTLIYSSIIFLVTVVFCFLIFFYIYRFCYKQLRYKKFRKLCFFFFNRHRSSKWFTITTRLRI